jgi:hypothetical protein
MCWLFFSVQDYVFIDFLCMGVCVDCFFLFRIMCLLISPVWVNVLIVFFCSGLCVYWFPLFGCMCWLFFSVQDYVFIDFLCLGVCVDCFFLFRIMCLKTINTYTQTGEINKHIILNRKKQSTHSPKQRKSINT